MPRRQRSCRNKGGLLARFIAFWNKPVRKLGSYTNNPRAKKAYPTPKAHRETSKWVVRYTNQQRVKYHLKPFEQSNILQSSAQGHSNWMARHTFGHTGYGGSNANQRITQMGYGGSMTAENIYRYPARRDRKKLAKGLVDGWMRSPGHRANILNRDLRYIGVGVAESRDYIYATQNFGG